MEVYIGEYVKEFVLSLNPRDRARITGAIDLLGEFGHELKMPHSKAIGGGWYELRAVGKVQVRILYFVHNSRALLLHGFIKKSEKIPNRALKIAVRRKMGLGLD